MTHPPPTYLLHASLLLGEFHSFLLLDSLLHHLPVVPELLCGPTGLLMGTPMACTDDWGLEQQHLGEKFTFAYWDGGLTFWAEEETHLWVYPVNEEAESLNS